MKKFLVLALLTGIAYSQPERRYWTFRGFGEDLVQCQLVNNRTQNCRFISKATHPLDGVMEAIHRATKGQETFK